jgi:hypothetical protein
MTKKIAIWSIAACLAAAAFSPMAVSGQSGSQTQGCGLQTLKGSYAFRNEGWFPGTAPGQPPRIPAAFVGVMTFDGAGSAWIRNTGSIDGAVFSGLFSAPNPGVYTVNEDCTGTLNNNFAHIVIADNGKSAFLVVTSPNNLTFTGEIRKQ